MAATSSDARERDRLEAEQRAQRIRDQAERVRGQTQREQTPARAIRGRDESARSVRERVDDARAAQALANVRDPGWWNRATVGDLERAQAAAQSTAASAGNRAAIQSQMNNVARQRYGTDVQGAIQYEGRNPGQPPPDMRGDAMTRRQ